MEACIIATAVASALLATPPANYTFKYIEQPVDHFSFVDGASFKQRYILDDTHFRPGAPVVLYPGNEAPITAFASSAGLVWEIAATLNARVVFAEHRYYGESQPNPANASDFSHLTVAQALQDFAVLIDQIRPTPPTPVVAVGGSYGGMLAVYLRTKFPHLVTAALGSSAPILGSSSPDRIHLLHDIVAADLGSCAGGIKKGFEAIQQELSQGNARRIADQLGLCGPVADGQGDALLGLLQHTIFTIAQLDYPYPTDFIGTSLPGHPTEVACQNFDAAFKASGGDPVSGVAAAISITRPHGECLPTPPSGARFMDYLPGFIDGAWTFQRCTEVILPCAVGLGNPLFLGCDVFSPNCWDFAAFSDYCAGRFGVRPVPATLPITYGGGDINASTNVILSNGMLDPWRSGGVQYNISGTVRAILIDGAAHHLDLRAGNPHDPPAVTDARAEEIKLLQHWIAEASGSRH